MKIIECLILFIPMLIESLVYTINQACYLECSRSYFQTHRIFNSMFKYESSMLFWIISKDFFKTLIILFTFVQVINDMNLYLSSHIWMQLIDDMNAWPLNAKRPIITDTHFTTKNTHFTKTHKHSWDGPVRGPNYFHLFPYI